MRIRMEASRTARELAALCGGTLYSRGHGPLPSVTGICTDSREADADTMLCAMRGERVDGHTFLPAAIRAGCRLCLCERLPDGWETADTPTEGGSVAAIVVADTVAALLHMAAARRETELSALHTVAVTGSVGKTTTKEMIAAVLAAGCRDRGRLFKKDGNYNSVIGLPLSAMEIPQAATHAVLEMGMSGRGEIAAMTAAARPDIALITNIGSSHLERLGTRENIAAAKLEIAEGLREGGTLLLCGDEPLLAAVGEDASALPAGVRVLRLSLSPERAPEADFAIEHTMADAAGMRFDLRTPDGCLKDLYVPAVGLHMVWAGAFAAAVGVLCGFSPERIRAGLADYRPAALRQSRRTVADVTFIEDCYNAAPESMRAAFDVLDIIASHAPPPTRRIAVLGSMLELGEHTARHHRAVGVSLAEHHPDLLITVGALGAHIAEGARAGGLPAERILTLGRAVTPDTLGASDDYSAIAAVMAEQLRPGDHLLFKASRSMRLEELAHALEVALTVDENKKTIDAYTERKENP